MKKNVLVLSFVALFIFSSPISATLKKGTLLELESKSGGFKQTKNIPEAMLATVGRYRKNSFFTDEIFERFSSDTTQLFNHNLLMEQRRASISKEISEKEAQLILSWLNSELGKRITDAEIANSTASALKEMHLNKETLLADSKGVEFSKRLDQVLGLSDRQVKEGVEDIRLWSTILKGRNRFAKESDEVSGKQVDLLTRKIIESNTLWGIKTYEDFTEVEKLSYLEFLSSEAYQKYYKAKNLASDKYMTDYGLAVVTSFSDFLYKDQFLLDPHLVVSYPKGEDLTFQSIENGGQEYLMGWTGEEQDFEFIYVNGISDKLTTEHFWQEIENAVNQRYGESNLETLSSGADRSEWGAEIEYKVFMPTDPEQNLSIFFRIFNSRINYVVSVVAFNREAAELSLNRTLNIMKTAKVIK